MAKRFSKWLKKKKRADCNYRTNLVTDESEDGEEETSDHFFRSIDTDPCIPTNELRVFIGTWNVGGKSPVGNLTVDLDEWLNLKEAADIYVLGFQEIVPLKTLNVLGLADKTEATNWNLLIGKALKAYGGRSSSKYKMMASKRMVGVFICVWMKKGVLRKYSVSKARVSSVACGIMGCLGNKGAVTVSMSIEGVSFCFIAAHLASGEKKGDEGRRNRQVLEIFRRTSFLLPSKDDPNDDHYHPPTILGHDRIFWFGDLNYRLYLEDHLARDLVSKYDWEALQAYDQLRCELEEGGAFEGWREGNLEFAPTYKYSESNCDRYSGSFGGRSGEKQRTPAWCDRILWWGEGVKQLSYFRSESMFSDHRPVSALFSMEVEVRKETNQKVFPVNATEFRPLENLLPRNSEEDNKPATLLSMLERDIDE
ncbi:unnamed protein product [Linum trigynum]|uniref:Inositol polyphosphate-related phosphatase domain-containing protein n=1 Tax=Linum trigynum TaxID=586398 RepID=A0AAV2CP95_9ROSI